jgi:hypothetical protein
MAYPEYTSCTSVNDALDHQKAHDAPWGEMLFAGLSAGLIHAGAFVIVAAILDLATKAVAIGSVIVISLLIFALYAMVTYCDWWLKHRLVCLDGDNNHCAIGFVTLFEPPEQKTGFDSFDTDFSMNIGLVGTWFGDTNLDTISDIPPYGYLLEDKRANHFNSVLTSFPLTGENSFGDLDPPGNPKKIQNDTKSPYYNQPYMKTLHVEFEGGGVATLRKWLLALIAFLVLADAVALACSTGLFEWACVLLAILFQLLLLGGPAAIFSALADKANPGEIDKALGSLALGDVVLVYGRWVYDSGHANDRVGWNEIHPIRHCQIIRNGPFRGDWATLDPTDIYAWCKAVGDAVSGPVKADQQKPENGWDIHPLVDGCSRSGPFHPR